MSTPDEIRAQLIDVMQDKFWDTYGSGDVFGAVLDAALGERSESGQPLLIISEQVGWGRCSDGFGWEFRTSTNFRGGVPIFVARDTEE